MSPIWVKFLGNWGEITLKVDRFYEAFTQRHKLVCYSQKIYPRSPKTNVKIFKFVTRMSSGVSSAEMLSIYHLMYQELGRKELLLNQTHPQPGGKEGKQQSTGTSCRRAQERRC